MGFLSPTGVSRFPFPAIAGISRSYLGNRHRVCLPVLAPARLLIEWPQVQVLSLSPKGSM